MRDVGNKFRDFVNKKLLTLLVLSVTGIGVFSLAPKSSATTITPTFVSGNPTCQQLGYAFEAKIDPADPGTVTQTVGSLGSITLTVDGDDRYFNWTSTFGIDAVIAKGGPNANVYAYNPPGAESMGDTGLVSPTNPSNGLPYGVSHVSFCYDIELQVSKTATTTYTRDYDWTISKSVDQTNITLSPGQQYQVNYSVVANKDAGTDSNWVVSGNITVKNPHPSLVASGIVVTDTLSNIGVIPVTCPSTTLAAGATMVCTYSYDLPNGDSRTNTASATTTTVGIGAGSGSTAVTFSNPTTTMDNCVNVSDSIKGLLNSNLCSSQTFNYAVWIDASTLQCGQNTVNNIASLATDDEQTKTSTATVNVNVECNQGCTLTQGYWKTHNNSFRGGAPSDDTWLLLSGGQAEKTIFFASGKTWFDVFWTAPQGNPYYNLAHQYMAAKLNVLNGATTPLAVSNAITQAEALFNGLNPNTNFTKAQKQTMVNLAGILGSFNEGLIGPGHCSE